jgi:GTP:adenosylcobinamide-phosphate guanylyltransferase
VDVFFPMAGQGARFGNKFKPFLAIDGDTFIEAAVAPFRSVASSISRFVFAYLESQEQEFQVSRRLAAMFRGLPFEVALLSTPTRGPAETIGLAVHKLGATGPAFICDCDHALDVTPLFDAVAHGTPFDALLPVWPLDGENVASWSVALIDAGRVSAIGEKEVPREGRGSPMGVIGCYGFADVAKTTERAMSLGATNFSDVIRKMLADDDIVRAVPIARARFFGDPERLVRAQGRGPG